MAKSREKKTRDFTNVRCVKEEYHKVLIRLRRYRKGGGKNVSSYFEMRSSLGNTNMRWSEKRDWQRK